ARTRFHLQCGDPAAVPRAERGRGGGAAVVVCHGGSARRGVGQPFGNAEPVECPLSTTEPCCTTRAVAHPIRRRAPMTCRDARRKHRREARRRCSWWTTPMATATPSRGCCAVPEWW